MHAVVYTWYH